MSLYYEAASLATSSAESEGSLKIRVYGAKGLKAPPAQIYALLSEASKWNSILKEVIEQSSILSQERKLTPLLALLLVHDLLLAKRGIAAPAGHVLRKAVERHRARLQAELTRMRVRKGFPSLATLREYVRSGAERHKIVALSNGTNSKSTQEGISHPRWIRVNALRTTLEAQLQSTFEDYTEVPALEEVIQVESTTAARQILYIDRHVPDLLALPAHTDLSQVNAYKKGELIIQDKASCFPAYLLSPELHDGDILDACAAPGNKTTHLSALLYKSSEGASTRRIWACDRDESRSVTLKKMVEVAGAQKMVTVKAGQDFLRLNPNADPWKRVGAILLDPSCSGSGIVGRGNEIAFQLPEEGKGTLSSKGSTGRKRKRTGQQLIKSVCTTSAENEELVPLEESPIEDRLKSLQAFQKKLLLHAFSFPEAVKVTYSTCSIYDAENEEVVLAALMSPVAKEKGWQILKRAEQVSGMKAWHLRGNADAVFRSMPESSNGTQVEREGREIAEACIRCAKHTEDGTQGFFVAAFKRKLPGDDGLPDEVEWEGFDDDGENP